MYYTSRAFFGVASSAATRNDRGTSRQISEEEVEKEKVEEGEGDEEIDEEEEKKSLRKEIVAKALDGQRYPCHALVDCG